MINEKDIQNITSEEVRERMEAAFAEAFAYYAALYFADVLESGDDTETNISLDTINQMGNQLAEILLDNDSFCLNEADDMLNDYLESIGVVGQRKYDDEEDAEEVDFEAMDSEEDDY